MIQRPSFTEPRDVKHKVLYHMTREIRDKSTALSVIANLNKFLLNCRMHIFCKQTKDAWELKRSEILQILKIINVYLSKLLYQLVGVVAFP